MLHLELENSKNDNQVPKELEIFNGDDIDDRELLEGSDKYPAPSTPQQKHGMRLVDDGDCQDQMNCSLEKECGEQDGESSKSVETTCINTLGEGTSQVENSQLPVNEAVKEEENSADGCRAASNIDHELHDRDRISSSDKNKSKSGLGNLCGTKGSRKKLKVYILNFNSEVHVLDLN